MSKKKDLVDRHVSHILARCETALERDALGLDIAKLYMDISYFELSKKYLKVYIQSYNDSIPALILLGQVCESLNEIPDALHAYKSAYSSGARDIQLLNHVCHIVVEADIKEDNLKFWMNTASSLMARADITLLLKDKLSRCSDTVSKQGNIERLCSQLKNDPSNSKLCMMVSQEALSSGDSNKVVNHFLNCINAGYHDDSVSWIRNMLNTLENLPSKSEDHISLLAVGNLLFLRLTASTSCLSDASSQLINLSHIIEKLASKGISRLLELSRSWLYYYTAVYARRCMLEFGDKLNGHSIIRTLHCHVTAEKSTNATDQTSCFSTSVWEKLRLFDREHYFVAQCLIRRCGLLGHRSLSWDELMQRINEELKIPNPERSGNGLKNPTKSSKNEDYLDAKCMWEMSRELLLLNPRNLPLILWTCAQLSHISPENEDCILSTQRLEFIATFVTAAFPKLGLSNLPLPFNFGNLPNVPVSSGIQLCQLDFVCFLMATFVQMAIRTVTTILGRKTKSETPGFPHSWLLLPPCLVCDSVSPTAPQKRWFEHAMEFSLLNKSPESSRSSTILPCGVNQLRLVARQASCFGRQSGMFPTSLLFRVARAFTHLSSWSGYSGKKDNIVNWAAGYWQAALQHQVFGTPPPAFPTILAQSVPSCSSSISVINDRWQSRSPASPNRVPSRTTGPTSQSTTYHQLFSLPPDCNWWLDLKVSDTSAQSIDWIWYNNGLCFLLKLLDSRMLEHSHLSNNDKNILRCLLRLFDQGDTIINPETYCLRDEVLKHYTEINAVVRDSDKMNNTSHIVDDSLIEDVLNRSDRSQFYSTGSVDTKTLLNDQYETDPVSTGYSGVPDTMPQTQNSPSASRTQISAGSRNDPAPSITVPNNVSPQSFPIQSTVGSNSSNHVQEGVTTNADIVDLTQEMLMASLLNSWQSVVNNLTCQLADTRAELSHNRQLNEQLSKQLNETSKQLSQAMEKFLHVQEKGVVKSSGCTNETLQEAVKELNHTMSDLRRWLPEGMASAAVASVNAHSAQRFPTPTLPTFATESAPWMQFHHTGLPPVMQSQIPTPGQFPVQTLPSSSCLPLQTTVDNTTVAQPKATPQASRGTLFSAALPNTFASISLSPQPLRIETPKKILPQLLPSIQKPHIEEESEHFDESYEPEVNFKPAVESLPDLVDQKTGEEAEERLFFDRARLYRYDKPSESWKTRGVGDVRILHNTLLHKYRLVMRRDQVKKLCANHAITSDLKLKAHAKDDRMAMWVVRDYAEMTEGKDETFMLQFKSAEIMTQFKSIFSDCVTRCEIRTQPEKPISSPFPTSKPTDPSPLKPYQRATNPDGWSCTTCYVENTAGDKCCIACKTIRTQDVSKTVSTKPPLAMFKPKAGSWDCPTCMLHHIGSVLMCPACRTAKPGEPTSLFGNLSTGTSGFVFGLPKSTVSTPTTSESTVKDIASTKPSFSFPGAAPKTTVSSTDASQDPASKSIFYFGNRPTPAQVDSPKKVPDTKVDDKSVSAFSTLSLTNGLTSKSGGFSFNFGTPVTGVNTGEGQNLSVPNPVEEDDDTEVVPADENELNFKPVLEVVPDKVTVVTGEENDQLIFSERAKLYRWDSTSWRERGVGELKLSRAYNSNSVRCLMRRDHVFKVCCNHLITAGMQLKPMNSTDGRSWTWWAIDFTELSPAEMESNEQTSNNTLGHRETFAVRFKTKEHAMLFHENFTTAATEAEKRQHALSDAVKVSDTENSVDLDDTINERNSEDVQLIESSLKVSPVQLSRARQLRLPDEFFAYENGHTSGEREALTAEEEAEEDGLLQAAVLATGDVQSTTVDSVDSHSSNQASITGHKDDIANSVCSGITSTNSSSVVTPIGTSSGLLGSLMNGSNVTFGARTLPDFSALSATVSNVSQPVWASPAVNANSETKTWSSACVPLFPKANADSAARNEDEEDEIDPHYEPVISLPELVKTQSGEESELCIFLRRCRVYRYVDQMWKERGVGEMKVLLSPTSFPAEFERSARAVLPENVHLDSVIRARLLMRRDQVLKLCVNQPISRDVPSFKPVGSGDMCVCWVGVDHSEGVGKHETSAVRFKTKGDMEEFKAAVVRAQSLLIQAHEETE